MPTTPRDRKHVFLHAIVAPLKAFLLGQKYQKKLEEKLKAVLAATEAVKAEATLCLHEVNAQGLAEQQHNETQRIYPCRAFS